MHRGRYVGLSRFIPSPSSDGKPFGQSGYNNTDPLAEKATYFSSRPDLEARGSSPVERAENEQLTPIPAKVPFYRTRKCIIAIIVVLVVVIAAAAVGGGVAASRKKPVSSHHGASITPGTAAHTVTKTVVTVVPQGPPTTFATFPLTIAPVPTIVDTSGLIGAGIS